jgi:hypothetical protein
VVETRERQRHVTVRASAGMSMRPHAVNARAPNTQLDFEIDTGVR